MKRIGFITVLFLMLVIPTIGLAQNSPGPVWDLTNTFTVTDLGFQFFYPTDWVYDTSGGITLAETKADIQANNDTSDSTVAKGAVVTINAIKASDLEAQVGSNPTLEDIADWLVKTGDVTETEARVEIPVMARRTLSVIGTSKKDGRGGFATIWRQGDYVVLATMSAKDMTELIRDAYSWGQILGGMTPTDALPLSDKPITIDVGSFEVKLPQKWYPQPDNPNVVYELKDDMKQNTFTGDIMVAGAKTLKDAGLTAKSTLHDLVDQNIKTFGLQEPIRREEFIILGQPALTLRGSDSSGKWALVTQAIVNDAAITLAAAAPSEDKINEIEPTFIAVLQSIKAQDKQS
jgi:hypothetical protein